MVEELSAALAEYLFLEIFDEATYHRSSCTVSEVFFFSFPCTNSSGSLFSEELKTIIFGFKNSLFLSEFYHDTSLFNLEQF